MKDYNKLAVKHGVYNEYKNACEKEKSGAGNGWRIDVEKALDSAERGNDIVEAMKFWCGLKTMPASHIEYGLRYRD